MPIGINLESDRRQDLYANGYKMSSDQPARRGRPRSFDEGVVLDQARAVFLQKGFDATSLDDLSAATGLTRPSLYGAFGNKEALYRRVLEHFIVRMRRGFRAGSQGATDLHSALAGVLRAAIRVYTEDGTAALGCMLVGTGATLTPTSPTVADMMRAALAEMETGFARMFARHAPDRDGAAGACLAAAAMQSLSLKARAGVPFGALNAQADAMARYLAAPVNPSARDRAGASDAVFLRSADHSTRQTGRDD